MKIKTKFNLFIFILSTVFLSVTLYIVNNVVLRGFIGVENDLTHIKLIQFEEAHKRELEELNTKIVDWAWWDDTYEYLKKPDKDYEKSNLNYTALNSLKISGILLFDSQKNLVKQIGYDSFQEKPISFSSPFTEKFAHDGRLSNFKEISEIKNGFIKDTNNTIYIFSSSPVLTSEKQGPSNGTIVFLRKFDKPVWERISATTQLNYDFSNWKEVKEKNWLEGKKEGTLWFQTEKESIQGYFVVTDYFGEALGISRFTVERSIYDEGVKSLSLLSITLGSIWLFTALITYIMLRKLVIDKLIFLNKEVKEIKIKENSFSAIKEFSGKDELTELSQSINSMIFSLQSSKELLKTKKENIQTYIDIIAVMIVVLNLEGKIVLINKKAGEILGVIPEEMVGADWVDSFIEPEKQGEVKNFFQKIITGNITSSLEYENIEHFILTKKKEKRLIHWHNSVMKDENGKTISILSAGEDITEKKIQEMEKEKNIIEIERLNELMVGRELKMAEMKKQIAQKDQK